MTEEQLEKLQNYRDKVDIIIGVDPDVSKSGIAFINVKETLVESLHSLPFPMLIDAIFARSERAKREHQTLKVVIEAGWLNASNWHVRPNSNARLAAKIGNATGRNHETGRKIAEMLKWYNITVELAKPLAKCWNGEDRKITQQELEQIVGHKLQRTNQDARDACLLAWTTANLPIWIRKK